MNKINFVENFESAKFYDALPRFTSEVYDSLNINNSIVADIGAGTGRVTIDLLERNNKVFAIEPDINMRKICKSNCSKCKGNLKLVNGMDSNMNIPDNSVNYVLVSQSYHRFNIELFKKESCRVLKDNGNIIIMWYRVDFNNTIIKDMLNSLKKNYSKYETRYGNVDEIEGSLNEEKENNEGVINDFNNNVEFNEVYSYPRLSLDEFINLGLSLSLFPITHEMNTVTDVLYSKEFNINEYVKSLKLIFSKYKKEKYIELNFKVQIFKIKKENIYLQK